MVKTTEYNYAVDRLKTLSKLNPVADSGVEREREVLSELIAHYEAEHDCEALAEYDAMVDFEDRFLASMER